MTDSKDDPLEHLQREVEHLFRDLIYHRHPAAHFSVQPWQPPADLVVTRDSARVILELAGVPRESVRVRLRARVLEVSGRRTPPQEPRGAHYHRAEIYFGEFRRIVELPWDADDNSVTATYRDGMLEIRLQPVRQPESAEISVEESSS